MQTKLNLHSQEYEALVDYYIKYHRWFTSIRDVGFAGIDHESMHKLTEIRKNLSDAKLDFDLAQGKRELFVQNEELLDADYRVVSNTFKFQRLVEDTTYKLSQHFLAIQYMYATTPGKEQVEKFEQLLNVTTQLNADYRAACEKLNSELYPLVLQLRAVVHHHINKIALADEESA